MRQARLNDAAVKLCQRLDAAHIKYGIFGGYAIGVLGGPRESKDIDCIASISKLALIDLLHGRSGFQVVPQTRNDYVAFLWSDKQDRREPVLVEVFVEQFEGATHPMRNVSTHIMAVQGQVTPSGTICVLDPVYIFKGKLRAAATRAKYHDSADIRWLVSRAENKLKENKEEYRLGHVGFAIKRYPELESTFLRLGIDVREAKRIVAPHALGAIPPPEPGDVQSGILG